MKWFHVLNLPRSIYLFPGLSILGIAIAPLLVQASTKWILPHFSSGAPSVVAPTIPSSLKVSWNPICNQPNSTVVEASTSAESGQHSIQFAGRESIEAQWKAKLSPVPFPQIHGRARLAHVPVMVYREVLPEKIADLEAQFQKIQQAGLTPIRSEQLVEHLKTGIPLPEKPIVLMFDAGYQQVYPLLQKYKFPATLAIAPGQPGLNWEQLKPIASDPLVTIASQSLTRPADLTTLSDTQLQQELVESKQLLSTKLGVAIVDFVYPEGKNDDRVQQAVKQAGYQAAWTMKGAVNGAVKEEEILFAENSESLLNLQRIGASKLDQAIAKANGGPKLKFLGDALNFQDPVQLKRTMVNQVPLILASGGQPLTIHAKTRSQVAEIVTKTPAIAAVDGTFFSLEQLDSNQMIGPVLSRETGVFVPGKSGENPFLQGRPLVLISEKTIKFIPFDAKRHNTKASLEAELPGVTDAFVGAGWLVKDGKPQPLESFGKLYSVNEERDRAFWGVDWNDRPVVGVSGDAVGSVKLGQALGQAGMRDVVMLDSGASASLVYNKESMMSYVPRPVPHVVALNPPQSVDRLCQAGNQTSGQ
jgi:poly-beta-1,6-N-acetyl-D-glucosamine N-deacetylase